jgi:hypothetical protein
LFIRIGKSVGIKAGYRRGVGATFGTGVEKSGRPGTPWAQATIRKTKGSGKQTFHSISKAGCKFEQCKFAFAVKDDQHYKDANQIHSKAGKHEGTLITREKRRSST